MNARFRCYAVSLCLALLAAPAFAQTFQVAQAGAKYTPSGVTSPAGLGFGLAVSADGSTAVIGAPRTNANTGAAIAYTRSGDSWVRQGPALLPTGLVGAGFFGANVAISADGNTAAIGAYMDNGLAGATFIFTRSNGVWAQQGAKLVGTGGVGGGHQSVSLALSADGNTLLVGAANDNAGVGAAWFFVRSNGFWTQQGGKLVGAGTVGAANFGAGTALSADGNTAVVSGHTDNATRGAGWVYTRSGGVWTQQGGKLLPAGAAGNPALGRTATLSADGNTAVLGGYNDNGLQGALWVYTRTGGVWTQYGAKVTATGAVGLGRLGLGLQITPDGQTLISGGINDNSSVGTAWIFKLQNGVWTQVGNKLVPNDMVGSPGLGFAVGITGDASGVWVGGGDDNSADGAAWFYTIKRVQAFSLGALPARMVSDAPFQITASGASSSPLAFSSSSPAICSVSSTGVVTLTGQLGTCSLNASDPGDLYTAASSAFASFPVGQGTQAPPQNVACSAGIGQVTCTFVPPAPPVGGTGAVPALTGYTLNCASSTATYTVSSSASPLVLTGLPLGVPLQCSVASTNSIGTGTGFAVASPLQPYSLLSRQGGIDTDGDGKGEILIRSGDVLLSGKLNAQNQISLTAVAAPGAGNRILGVGDFGARGKSDLLLQDVVSNDVGIWTNFDSFVDSRRAVRGVKTGWVVDAVADLDGDGKSDIVWRYTGVSPNPDDTGVVFVWFMNDDKITEIKHWGGAPPSWNLIGSTDLHGTGGSDLIWVSPSNAIRSLTAQPGRNYVNEPIGTVPAGSAAGPAARGVVMSAALNPARTNVHSST